jgi:hypothetical protein
MPPHLYERVNKWTHEPWSIFIHKKHLLVAFIFPALIKSENTKNMFTSYNYNQNQKKTLITCIRLHYTFSLPSSNFFIVFISFY